MIQTAKSLGLLALLWSSLSVCAAEGPSASEVVPGVSGTTPVATIGNKPIPYSELEVTTHDKVAQLQHDYDMQLRQLSLGAERKRAEYLEGELERLVDERVISLEAAARKTTEGALLSAIKTPDVSDADLHAFYDSQQAQIGQSFEAASSQIKTFLQHQREAEAQLHYIQSLRDKYKAVVTYEPLREQVDVIGPQRGPRDAPVTIVEFSDFQCPFCGRLAPILRQVLNEYPNQVRLVFRNNPLTSIHPYAAKAADAAECANLQGKFWEMHDLLYAEQNSLSVDALKEKARRLGLDTDQFNTCMDSSQTPAHIQEDREASAQLGLTTTPSSFVNGRFVGGAMPLYKWEALIDDELRRAAQRNSRG